MMVIDANKHRAKIITPINYISLRVMDIIIIFNFLYRTGNRKKIIIL